VLVLGGCGAIERTIRGPSGAKASSPATPTPTQTPRAFYAGVDGLKVHSEPSAGSKVVGTLALHEKVTRTDVERGYAYVTSATTGLKGWVSNAQLIWRLPGTKEPAAAHMPPEAPAAAEPEAPAPAAPAPEVPATATTTTRVRAAPSSTSTIPPGGVPPSIFNPY
jgi:hypothetical protein